MYKIIEMKGPNRGGKETRMRSFRIRHLLQKKSLNTCHLSMSEEETLPSSFFILKLKFISLLSRHNSSLCFRDTSKKIRKTKLYIDSPSTNRSPFFDIYKHILFTAEITISFFLLPQLATKIRASLVNII